MTDLITTMNQTDLRPQTNPTVLHHEKNEQGITLSTAARSLARAGIAKNTWKNHGAQIKQIEQWLNGRILNDVLLAEYLAERFNAGLAPESLGQALSAVKFVTRQQNIKMDFSNSEEVLEGARRKGKGRGRGQAKPLHWSEVEKVCETAIAKGLTAGYRDSALIRVMSDGLLRISEAIALDVSDISYNNDETGNALIRQSKTDQTGRGASVFLEPETMDAIKTYTTRANIDNGALFRRIWKGGNNVSDTRLSLNGARHAIKTACETAGVKDITGHSMRVGSAQELVLEGATMPELLQVGRWKNETMPAHYTKDQAAGKNAIARYKTEWRKRERSKAKARARMKRK